MEDIIFGIKASIIGCVVVFIALILIYWGVSLFRYFGKQTQVHKESLTFLPLDTRGPDLSPDIVAVISAAVAVAIDKKHRIKRIRYRSVRPESAWTKQGIASIMASHTITKVSRE